MRIPVRDRLPGLDRGAVLDVDGGAVGQLVAFALAAVCVEHRQFARTRHRDQVATGMGDGLEVVELDRAGGLDRHVVDRRRTRGRATDVERTHGQLGARLADQIARASCREREWPYVYLPVCAEA